jgi:hypothetical protein
MDRHPKVSVNCQFCGKEFQARKERVDKGLGRFCCREHSWAWQRQQNTKLGENNAVKFFDKSQNSWKVHWLDGDRSQHSTTYSHWRWKQLHGDVPVGFRVGFVDGNSLNIEDDNFKLVSEAEIGKKVSASKMGWNPSEETRKRMSESAKVKEFSPEHRAKIGEGTKARWENGEFDNQRKPKVEKVKKIRIYPTGQKMSDEQKQKISTSLKGRTFSDEHRKKLSDANIGKFTGAENKFWKGGISEIPYPPEFGDYLKKKVRKKFNWECQICGKSVKGSRFAHVHHIDGNKQNCGEENLTLLCASCHSRVHNTVLDEITKRISHYQSLLKYDDNGQCET